VQAITRDDLVAFHRLYHPAAMRIAVVGDVEPEPMIAELERAFGGWEPLADPVRLDIPAAPAVQGFQRRDIPMAGKVQSDIIWGVHGLKRSDPDYYAAMIANMVLGRLGIGGRLGENVRENQGMAYYVSSSLEADLGAGPWLAIAGVNPANVERAIQAMLHEIDTFKQDGPTEQELSDVRAFLTGSLVLGLETSSGIAGALLAIERHNLGMDYIVRYPDLINGVTSEDVVRVARRYLSTENCVLTVAGPAVSSGTKGETI
jgi:zinc protease